MKASLRSQTSNQVNQSGTASTGLDDGVSLLRTRRAQRKRTASTSMMNFDVAPDPSERQEGPPLKRFKKEDGVASPIYPKDSAPIQGNEEDAKDVSDLRMDIVSSGAGLDGDLCAMTPTEIVAELTCTDSYRNQMAANEARVLAQQEKHRRSLAEAGILPVLVEALKSAESESLIRQLVGALWNLGVNVSNNKEIVTLGATLKLVSFLGHESPRVQRVAAGAIRCLAWKHDSNRQIIANEGGIRPLIDLASSPVLEVQEQACAALWNLGLNTAVSEMITNEGAVKVMVRLVSSDITELQRVAAGVLRCLAYMYEPNRINIANEGGIKYLCRLLSSPSVKVQQQAAAALGNLTYRNGPNRITVTTEGGVGRLVAQLSSRSSEVQLMASTTLRNLALNEENRVAIGRAGAIPPLVTLLEAPRQDLQVQVAAAIWNLSLNDQNKAILSSHGALNKLYGLYRSTSNDVVYYAKGALFAMGIELDRPQQ